jgi:hypothetical protein
VETLEQRKQGMIAALWSNPNLDDDKGTRKSAIEDIEEKCEEAVRMILTGIDPDEEVIVEDTYGFFAAGERGAAKITSPRDDEGTVREAVDYGSYIDQ